ncbi:cyclin-dependent kinase inhibitor 1B [Erpetoichthys calabaricus]|uniref:Cyclin-dependent kinase inhibitor 1B n=1 Tax=Erpetoichthys calabaricus TaxID=27687 RepID=A0A8C4SXE8_ERPCA|nr:cyclin-dependent kinase inhibitor 1B [Erpetoichthys calabaricus]
MSNVRVSNGSPTLERMDARQSDNPKPSACRILFGLPDHEELKKEFKKQRESIEAASRDRFNFDFVNYQPLPGRYKWEIVDGKDLPEFYTRPPRVKRKPDQKNLDHNGNSNTSSVASCQGSFETKILQEQGPGNSAMQKDCKDNSTGQRKRTASNEFSSQSKRANNGTALEEDEKICCQAVAMIEQTPRKSSPSHHT